MLCYIQNKSVHISGWTGPDADWDCIDDCVKDDCNQFLEDWSEQESRSRRNSTSIEAQLNTIDIIKIRIINFQTYMIRYSVAWIVFTKTEKFYKSCCHVIIACGFESIERTKICNFCFNSSPPVWRGTYV